MKFYLKLLSGELIPYEAERVIYNDICRAVHKHLSLDKRRYKVKLLDSCEENIVPVWIEDIVLSDSVPYHLASLDSVPYHLASPDGIEDEVSWWVNPPIGETEEYKIKLLAPISDEEKSSMFYNIGNEREHFLLSHTHFSEYITKRRDGACCSIWIKYYPRKELIQLTNPIDLCNDRLNYVLNSYENLVDGDNTELYFYDYIVQKSAKEYSSDK
jgi:hypothetical protein